MVMKYLLIVPRMAGLFKPAPAIKAVCKKTGVEYMAKNSEFAGLLHLNAGHYNLLAGWTAVGYVAFSLYDWRAEAKHDEAHGH